ncbi:hypothetical protein DSO57_1000848 [Entomophthora muscae]|uniref:Uncharacterized protein n=1 Tax=Entomophthora muscae TaxID=34485 RepID=A0ACC2U7M9_9FUNG|nr:hypothetical protein DSO57_1000848 [Entomophthora muscae]
MELSGWNFNPGQQGPVAAREEHVHGYHRKEFKDYYHWLRSGDEKTRQYLHSENAFSQAVLLSIRPLVGEIREELESFKGAKDDYPFAVGEYTYFDDKSQGLSNYTRATFGERESVKDFNEFGASTVVGAFAPSPYNDRVAYTIDPKGGGDYQLFIKDMCIKREIMALDNICENIIWSEEGDHLFYTTRDKHRKPFCLMRYSLADKRTHVVYSESSEGFRVEISQSTSKRYLFMNTESDTNNEIRFMDLRNPTSKLEVILPRQSGRLYYVEHHKKEFWFCTNHYKQAYKNFAVFKANIATLGKWSLAIPYNSTEYITGMYGLWNAVALEVRVEGIQHIKIIRNHLQHLVSFPEPVFHAKLALKQLDYATKKIQIVYSSPITPHSLMEYDLETELKPLHQDSYPDYNPKLYSVERIYTNTGVPITPCLQEIPIGWKQPPTT